TLVLFFFSRRRRHTRSKRDWSSDVCSSDLCALAILLGFVYLVVTKTISPAIPLTYVGSMFVFYLIATRSLHESLVEVLSGGLLFGAVFMATDYEIGRAHV